MSYEWIGTDSDEVFFSILMEILPSRSKRMSTSLKRHIRLVSLNDTLFKSRVTYGQKTPAKQNWWPKDPPSPLDWKLQRTYCFWTLHCSVFFFFFIETACPHGLLMMNCSNFFISVDFSLSCWCKSSGFLWKNKKTKN